MKIEMLQLDEAVEGDGVHVDEAVRRQRQRLQLAQIHEQAILNLADEKQKGEKT